MFSTAAIDVSGRSGCSVYAQAPSKREQDRSLRPLPVLRGERVGLGDLEQRDDSRSVIVGAVEDLCRIGAVVIEVRRDQHPFVLQPRIAAFEQRDDVSA